MTNTESNRKVALKFFRHINRFLEPETLTVRWTRERYVEIIDLLIELLEISRDAAKEQI